MFLQVRIDLEFFPSFDILDLPLQVQSKLTFELFEKHVCNVWENPRIFKGIIWPLLFSEGVIFRISPTFRKKKINFGRLKFFQLSVNSFLKHGWSQPFKGFSVCNFYKQKLLSSVNPCCLVSAWLCQNWVNHEKTKVASIAHHSDPCQNFDQILDKFAFNFEPKSNKSVEHLDKIPVFAFT